MGNRANFVIVENQDWRLYYSHWAGCRILDVLIGGPDLALRYAQTLRPCARTDGQLRCGPTAGRSWISIAGGCCSSATA